MKALFVFFLLLTNVCSADLYSEVTDAINVIRMRHGLCRLQRNEMLDQASKSQSDWMTKVGRMDHMRESPSSFEDYKICNYHPVNRVVNSGYVRFEDVFETVFNEKGVSVHPLPSAEFIDEIIAWGKAGEKAYRTDIIVDGWMRSPGHRKAILSPVFREMGVGITSPTYGEVYWCVVFGKR